MSILFLWLTRIAVYCYRNPDCTAPQDDGLVIAPADGTMVFADVIKEERFFSEEVLKIRIFISQLSVYVNLREP